MATYQQFIDEVSRKHLKPAYEAGVAAAKAGVNRDQPHHAKTGGLVSVAFIAGHMDEVGRIHSAAQRT